MKNQFSFITIGVLLFTIFGNYPLFANGTIIYVDADANGLNNGTSWTDAYTDLQSALSAAVSGSQIWVATGTYKPTKDSNSAVYFVMKSGVDMYGGFSGSEVSREERNWVDNVTILSGDLLDNDIFVIDSSGYLTQESEATMTDNSHHVLVGADNARLDGFTVKGGHGSGTMSGGGLYNYRTNPKVFNCTFINNAADTGGGVANIECSGTVIENCVFIKNCANTGGAMTDDISNTTILNCRFERNTSRSFGGGFLMFYSSATVINCDFYGNQTRSIDAHGGGLMIMGDSPIIADCIFVGNKARYSGGGIGNAGTSSKVINCTFFGNVSDTWGGGIGTYGNNNITVFNCIFWQNYWPQIYLTSTSVADIRYCDVQDGWPGEGNINLDPMFAVNPSPGLDGEWCTDDDNYGDLRLNIGSPCIDDANNALLPKDTLDLDNDGDVNEPLPFDIANRPRIFDANCDGKAVVDMGAYEFYLIGDLKIDCRVNFPDIAVFANNWLQTNCSSVNNWCSGSDTNRDGKTNFADLSAITKHWLEESL